MRSPKKIAVAALAASALAAGGAFAALGSAANPPLTLSEVPAANTKSEGYAPATRLSPELTATLAAQGSTPLENPSSLTSTYGYDNDVLNSAGQPVMVPTPKTMAEAEKLREAQKTDPDKNTYLKVPASLPGGDPKYGYGTRFLFQGHEAGAGGRGYLTRINLDADAAHRVTLLADKDNTGKPLATIDGSTFDPFSGKLLLTTENEGNPTYAASIYGYPSNVVDVSGALGRGGYEGIQDDSSGNIWIVEDISGSAKKTAAGASTKAKRPNSFLFRYVPATPGDLKNGKLQALRVYNEAELPITFASQEAIDAPDQVLLHSYGKTLKTEWVTVHDTAVDGRAPFSANAAAKAHDATPFKRPENGLFQPGSGFTKFYFDETGDTTNESPENNTAGGWGGIQLLTQSSPSANTGTLQLFYYGNEAHTGLDNNAFLSANQIAFVEDAGDTLHTQRNALDSAYLFNTETDYSSSANQPVRFIAEGRDPSATLDSAFGGFGKNDGDNEITGIHVSDGGTGAGGILGAKIPDLTSPSWSMFYTEQHGDNRTYELSYGG